ncbi:hypothetical protein [Streptomyces eurythermus]|uniref:hypothetical protein n=1 Tax=Streptomyces eurythermus TaxID=42237 RepID=UPI0033F8509C
MDVGNLVGVALGAVLAVGTGLATELWKLHQARRAAARLVWLELKIAHGVLLAAIALERWPPELPYSDEAWEVHKEQLALGWSASKFHDLQRLYFTLGHLFRQSPAQLANPVLYWKMFERLNGTLLSLGKIAGLDRVTLHRINMPPLDQIKRVRTQAESIEMAPYGKEQLKDDTIARTVNSFPPELRDSAKEALAKARSSQQDSGIFLKP